MIEVVCAPVATLILRFLCGGSLLNPIYKLRDFHWVWREISL